MTKKQKKHKVNEKTLRNINILELKLKLDNLENQSSEKYSPKIGRQLKQLKKQMKKVAWFVRRMQNYNF